MKRIGITGQQGFIGKFLYNTVSLLKDEFQLVPFERAFFENESDLEAWVSDCDIIVHLAAMNRHPDPQLIHDNNVVLVQKLVAALERTSSRPHVIFSSSLQENSDNLYGNSKKTGRVLLQNWAEKNEAKLTGMIVPNVFGPFGKPFYNSVIATFSHQLINGLQPHIDIDGQLKLIYVGELSAEIIKAIREDKHQPELLIQHTATYKVSELLSILNRFKTTYYDQGILPVLNNKFELNLFNTFRGYIQPENYFPKKFVQHTDERGTFAELARLNQSGQVSFSTTHPGVTRGNHFHTRKIERFAVIKGKARIQLRKYNTSEVLNFELDGNESSYVDMPVWYTHNITNVGDEELITIFWINEFFDPNDPDTYFEQV